MPRLPSEYPAEAFLRRMGLLRRRSVQRSVILGCIGCRWLRRAERGEEVNTYGLELARCTGIATGVVYPILSWLVESEVLHRQREAANPTRENLPQRVLYTPADTELGRAFYAELQAPSTCDLEAERVSG